ncbi:hypothetical protein DID88_004143 [Monilinia fructigena]|uniref:CENP-V/GFA domain-containing protein n=1 Tax=Monilinia fructigena TaxID=38457 RepID=A0A395ITS9_9HELO|nr:hypothetical protein DID88_004143 [Monilinia fructigena]
MQPGEPKTVTRTYAPFPSELFIQVEETSDEERTTHEGSCHCGAITFTVTLKWPFPKYTVNSCTCSICTKNGYLLVYPMRQDVKFLDESESKMGSYKWGRKIADHRSFWETDPRKDMVGINVRNFKNIDLEAMSYTYFDGRTSYNRTFLLSTFKL